MHYNYNYFPEICSALLYNYIFCTTTTITITHYIFKNKAVGVPKIVKVLGVSERFWAEKIFKRNLQYYSSKLAKIFIEKVIFCFHFSAILVPETGPFKGHKQLNKSGIKSTKKPKGATKG